MYKINEDTGRLEFEFAGEHKFAAGEVVEVAPSEDIIDPRWVDDQWIDGHPNADAVRLRRAKLKAHSDADAVVNEAMRTHVGSAEQLIVYSIKASEAKRHTADIPSVAVEKEATETGEDATELADAILAKYSEATINLGFIEGVRRKTNSSIDSAATVADCESAIQIAEQAIKGHFEQ